MTTSPRRHYTATCEVCGSVYHPFNKSQRFCSQTCFDQVRSQHRRNRKTCECLRCGKTFEVKAHQRGAYCSKECWSQRNPPLNKACEVCGETFETYNANQTTCSLKCSGERRGRIYVGEKAPAWKGGKTIGSERARLSNDLVQWREAVYKRDNYTCRLCGATGSLHAHHIKSFADHEDERTNIDNGLTVCIPCHEAIHGKKLSSPATYPKHCATCGAKTTGKSMHCRSCSSKLAHLAQGHKQAKTCAQCGNDFVPQRTEYKYCSAECGKAASITSQQVECSNCGKSLMRAPSLIARNTSGKWFCSAECQHAHSNQNVQVICPICGSSFNVKPYRVKDGQTPTCSPACRYKYISQRRLQSASP